MDAAALASRPRLFLVDAYAYVYRSYFAFSRNPLVNSRGENTSAAFGFATLLLNLLKEHEPEYGAVVFDSGRSHREELYPAYKATREKMPEELRESLPRIREIVEALGLAVVEIEGWEADDVIGTLAARAGAAGLESVIVSGDKDFYQLVRPGVKLLRPGRGGEGAAAEWIDEGNAAQGLGVAPAKVVDYLALVGDASDNIPGVPGVGPKTAVRLLGDFDSLDGVLERAAEVKGTKVRESLLANQTDVQLWRDLVTIRTDVETSVDLEDLRTAARDDERLRRLFLALEFTSLLRDLAPAEAALNEEARYEVLADAAAVASVVDACREAGAFAVAAFTETLASAHGRLAGIAVSVNPGRAVYLPFGHQRPEGLGLSDEDDREGTAWARLPPLGSPEMAPLRDLLADPSVAKIGHDLKRSVVACRRAGADLLGPFKDVMVASYLMDPGRRSHGLETLAHALLGVDAADETGLLGKGRKRVEFGAVSAASAKRFACERADLPLRLWGRFEERLAGQGLAGLFDEIEMPLVSALADMETAGVAIDGGFFRRASRRLGKELMLVRADVFRAAGAEFNLNSTRDLRVVLFETQGLPVLKRTKTGPSTDSSVLEELAVAGHELPRLIMDYRHLEKLRGTYVDALPAMLDAETGRLHTTFNQTVAATGRLSSSDPNLQNIPIRTPEGREIRKGFVAPEGSLLVTADYSQIELRILAHFSRDPVFVEAFNAGKDIHRETAAIIFDVAVEDVTGEMRDRAKTVNFATLYGQGPFSLARGLGISQSEAKAFIDQYFERFAGVRRFLDEQVEQARERGYVETLMGRRRYVPELRAKGWGVRQFGERVARNTPIQGTAADLIKVAMLRLAERLREDDGTRMLLQVHDELVFEAGESRADEVATIAKDVMESAWELAVPLRVDTGSGRTWYDCKA